MNSIPIALTLTKRMLGNKKGFFFLLVLPALAVAAALFVLLGISANEVTVEVLNRDKGTLGGVLVSELEEHREFKLRLVDKRADAEEKMIRQLAEAALIIPENFTEKVKSGQVPEVELKQLKYNEAVYFARTAVQSEVSQLADQAARLRKAGATVELEDQILKVYRDKREQAPIIRMARRDYGADDRVTATTGLLLIFLMSLAANSMGVIREDRQKRTLERLFASPVRPWELMLGHLLGCFLVGTLQILFVLTATRMLSGSGYPIAFGSQWLVLECFLLASLGLFAAVTALIDNTEHINTVHTLVITPTCMLGGCFWPVEVMSEPMQKLSNFVPQKWVIEAVGKLASGASLKDIPYHLGIVLLFGFILLSFGTAIWRPDDRK